MSASDTPVPGSGSRAGRDLPAAIAVGCLLAGTIFATLFTVRLIWVGVICAAVAVGTYELACALVRGGWHTPRVPSALVAGALPLVAYLAGPDGLVTSTAVGVVLLAGWLLVDSRQEPDSPALLSDLAALGFTLLYVGFLAGFAALLSQPSDGPRRVVTFIATCAGADIGGYAAGVLSGGRHKLAPTISPGKSWEGAAGAAVTCMVAGGMFFAFLLHRPVLLGVVFGLAVTASATLGDLGESMIKRDLDIKDMGNLLPGHGGVMDRLDSLLLTAPVAWVLITSWAPLS